MKVTVRFADNCFHLISTSSSVGESIKDCENVRYNTEICSVYEVKSKVIYTRGTINFTRNSVTEVSTLSAAGWVCA